jgi:hypothetical protein
MQGQALDDRAVLAEFVGVRAPHGFSQGLHGRIPGQETDIAGDGIDRGMKVAFCGEGQSLDPRLGQCGGIFPGIAVDQYAEQSQHEKRVKRENQRGFCTQTQMPECRGIEKALCHCRPPGSRSGRPFSGALLVRPPVAAPSARSRGA